MTIVPNPSRDDYMNKRCTHREYYAQFVNSWTKSVVVMRIGIDRLVNSSDEHLNDIPLEKWDSCRLMRNIKHTPDGEMVRMSLAEGVCIGKEAARQILDEYSLISLKEFLEKYDV